MPLLFHLPPTEPGEFFSRAAYAGMTRPTCWERSSYSQRLEEKKETEIGRALRRIVNAFSYSQPLEEDKEKRTEEGFCYSQWLEENASLDWYPMSRVNFGFPGSHDQHRPGQVGPAPPAERGPGVLMEGTPGTLVPLARPRQRV